MGFFDEWKEQENSDYILTTTYLEQLAKRYDSSIKATAEYLLRNGFRAALYFKEPDGSFKRDTTLYEEEHNYDEAPYEFLTHIIHNISEYKYASFKTDSSHLTLRYADRYFYKDDLPVINTSNIEAMLDDYQSKRDDELFHQLEQAKAKIDMLEKEHSSSSFMMGTPTVAHGEPKTYEQLVEALAAANAEIKQHKQTINKLSDQIDKSTKDKLLPYNSQMSVAKMLYAILTEHNYDLSATKGKANSLIEKASQVHGTSVARNFIAKWIELANQAKSDGTK